MRFSFWPTYQQPWDDIVDAVRHVDSTGWDGVYFADHFMGDDGGFGPVETPSLEVTAALPALAAMTSSVRLGALVMGTTYRHPAVVANWAVTLDHLSHGRSVLGLGAGWQQNEHEQYGIDLPPVRERIDRLAEVLEVTTSLLAAPRTTFAGRWFQLQDAVCEPKPVQPKLPLLVGGKGNRMLGLVARWADEWNMWSLPELLAERRARLDQRCAAIDRDPATIATSTQALVLITDDEERARQLVEATAPRPTFAGPASRFAELVAGWREVGVDEVVVPDFVLGTGSRRQDALDAIIETVAPTFRG